MSMTEKTQTKIKSENPNVAIISEIWSRKVEMVGDRTASEACLLNSDFFFSGWVQLHELIKTMVLLYISIQLAKSSGLISSMMETRHASSIELANPGKWRLEWIKDSGVDVTVEISSRFIPWLSSVKPVMLTVIYDAQRKFVFQSKSP